MTKHKRPDLWPDRSRPDPDRPGPERPNSDRVVDATGRVLPVAGSVVRDIVLDAFREPGTELVLLIARRGDDVFVQVAGEPSRETLALLQQTVTGYAATLRAHEQRDTH